MSYDPLESHATLHRFIGEFESGAYPLAQWTHREHVIMASWYLLHLTRFEATPTIRAGIQRYNLAQGGQNTATSGYHETLTLFWIHVLSHALDEARGDALTRIRAMAAEFGGRAGLYKDYYSHDVAQSVEARYEWMEPDMKPLPGTP
ncbi:MAG: hypothetical protein IT164_10915 [Bryobacterales bacterium]|nr:hypothetical protein [Bryobacterales bacterium]